MLGKLAVEMYARGLSVRDIEDTFRDGAGRPLLSREAVSQLSETLWEDYEAFCERDLSQFEVEYLFIDAIYEGLRAWGCSQGILCAWAICRDGSKVLLHLAMGSRESYENCLEFLRDMVRRGLRTPVLVTTDGAPGLIRATAEVWGKSLRQRCLAHKMRKYWTSFRRPFRKRSSGACRMSSMLPLWRWLKPELRRCWRITRRSILQLCAASTTTLELVWRTCAVHWHITRRFVRQTCWSGPFTSTETDESDPTFLHREGMPEIGLLGFVANQPALEPCNDD